MEFTIATKPTRVKDELLNAAIELLQTSGPQQATARAICDLVGVKQPTLYYHYGQLEKLHQQAVNAVFQQVADYYTPSSSVQTPEQSIRHSWHLFIHFSHENPQLFSFINQQIIKGNLPKFVDIAFQQLVTDLQLLGEKKPLQLSPQKAAQLLWAGANGAATLAAAAKARPEVDTQLVDDMLEALLKHIQSSDC